MERYIWQISGRCKFSFLAFPLMVAFRCVAVSRRPEQKNLNNARWNEVEDVNKTISSKTSNFQAVVSLATATCPSLATPQRAAKNRINFCEKYIRRLRHKRLKKKNGFNLDSTSNSFFFFSKIDYRLIFVHILETRARKTRALYFGWYRYYTGNILAEWYRLIFPIASDAIFIGRCRIVL